VSHLVSLTTEIVGSPSEVEKVRAQTALQSSADILVKNGSEAAQILGVLALRLATTLMQLAASGRPHYMQMAADGTLTGDSTANHFVSLYLQGAMLATSNDPEDAQLALETRDNLLGSFQNVSAEAEIATWAAVALAFRVAEIDAELN